MKQQMPAHSYSPENPPIYKKHDEIDLRDILVALWNGKLLIAVSTLLFFISSLGFALLAQEWWSSSATITNSQPQNLAEYQQQVIKFQPIFNLNQDDGTVLISHELNALVDSRVLFQRFIDTFNSSNNKRAFLKDSLEFQKILIDGEKSKVEGPAHVLYSKWFEKINAYMVDLSGGGAHYFVRFQAKTKDSSYKLLTDYISFTESKVHDDAFNNLQAVVNGKRNELIQLRSIIEAQAKNQLSVETAITMYAMKIAEAAGVERPIQTNNEKELFSIALGFKGLKAKLQALQTVKNLSVVEPRLQQVNAKLAMLDTLVIDRSVEFQTFRFVENVEQPITRDKPKRALIVLMATLFGGILGAAIILMRFLFRKGY